MDMKVSPETRLCEVNGRPGYFHCWEHFSKPVPASLLKGGAPAGVISSVFGIVEFSDGVKRIDPTCIDFCDEKNQLLYALEKEFKEDKNE